MVDVSFTKGFLSPVTSEFSKDVLGDDPKFSSARMSGLIPVPVSSDPKDEEVDADPEVDCSSVDIDDNVEGTDSTGRGGRGASEYKELRSAAVE
jgi:hypothetical protein